MKYTFSLRPEHAAFLHEEAFKRASAAGRGAPNTSQVMREILDEVLRKRG